MTGPFLAPQPLSLGQRSYVFGLFPSSRKKKLFNGENGSSFFYVRNGLNANKSNGF